MRIIVISDTHIPRVAQDLPQQIYREIENSDAIIHAGDFVEKSLLDKLRILRKTYAVSGNMDPEEVQKELKPREIVRIGKFRIGLVHGHGSARDLADRISGEFKDVDAIVFGHSHAALNVRKNGVLLFNPGSPTDKLFASERSYGVLEIAESIEGHIIRI